MFDASIHYTQFRVISSSGRQDRWPPLTQVIFVWFMKWLSGLNFFCSDIQVKRTKKHVFATKVRICSITAWRIRNSALHNPSEGSNKLAKLRRHALGPFHLDIWTEKVESWPPLHESHKNYLSEGRSPVLMPTWGYYTKLSVMNWCIKNIEYWIFVLFLYLARQFSPILQEYKN